MGTDRAKVLNIDGSEYEYFLNLNAMVKFEEETGRSFMDFETGDSLTVTDVRALVWAGMDECKNIEIEEVGRLLHHGNMKEVAAQIMSIYDEITPDGAEGEGQAEKNKKGSAG